MRALPAAVSANAIKTATIVPGTRHAAGGRRMASSVKRAPMVKKIEEASAACQAFTISLESGCRTASLCAARTWWPDNSVATRCAVVADRHLLW